MPDLDVSNPACSISTTHDRVSDQTVPLAVAKVFTDYRMEFQPLELRNGINTLWSEASSCGWIHNMTLDPFYSARNKPPFRMFSI